jgi:hypothetical protein
MRICMVYCNLLNLWLHFQVLWSRWWWRRGRSLLHQKPSSCAVETPIYRCLGEMSEWLCVRLMHEKKLTTVTFLGLPWYDLFLLRRFETAGTRKSFQAVTFLNCTRELPGSILSRNTDYNDWGGGDVIYPVLPNYCPNTSNRPRPLSLESFQTSSCVTTPSYHPTLTKLCIGYVVTYLRTVHEMQILYSVEWGGKTVINDKHMTIWKKTAAI